MYCEPVNHVFFKIVFIAIIFLLSGYHAHVGVAVTGQSVGPSLLSNI